jgi:hypothetical protein
MRGVWWSPIALTPEQPTPRPVLIALLIVYAAATLVVTLHHEPWRDEAETWLAARDLPLSNVLTWTRGTGSPALWPALVVPLARGGMPYVTQSLVHWTIAVGAAAVFLFCAPFTGTTKTLFLLSFYPAYQYAVIARSYALGILLLFAVVAWHARRHSNPLAYAILVALLANTNAHSGGPAFAAAAWYAVDLVRIRSRAPRAWVALLVMTAGLALAFLQVHTSGHVIPPTVVSAPYPQAFFDAATGAFFPGAESTPARLATIGMLALVLVFLRRNAEALGLALISLTALAFIFTFLVLGGFRHFGLVLMITIAALWLAAPVARQSRAGMLVAVALNVVLAASIATAARYAYADLTRNFSGSRELAQYLIRQHLDRREIAAHPPAHCEAVLPYLPPRTFWYAALGESGSYLRWDRAYRVAQATAATRAAEMAAAHYGTRDWLFVSAAPLAQPEALGLKLLYATREPLVEPRDARPEPNDERYWLYAREDAIATAP